MTERRWRERGGAPTVGAVTRRPHSVVVIVVGLVIVALTGCSHKAHRSDPSTASSEAVPGGAAVVVPPGSPPICSALAGAAAVRDLGNAAHKFASSDESALDTSPLTAAAQQLRTLSGQATGQLRTRLIDTADALDELTKAGPSDQDATTAASQTIVRLGDEVQSVCRFPVG